MIIRRIDSSEIRFDITRACKFLRVRKESPQYDLLLEMVSRIYQIYRDHVESQYVYTVVRVISVDEDAKQVTVEGGNIFSGAGVLNILRSASYTGIYMLTLGQRIDNDIAELSVRDIAEGFFLDGIASTLTHQLGQMVRNEIEIDAAVLNCSLTHRYAPGYSNWRLDDQKVIMDLLDSSRIGITLSESFFMIPRKSLSGVYGLCPLT
jgi:hypothetical protein